MLLRSHHTLSAGNLHALERLDVERQEKQASRIMAKQSPPKSSSASAIVALRRPPTVGASRSAVPSLRRSPTFNLPPSPYPSASTFPSTATRSRDMRHWWKDLLQYHQYVWPELHSPQKLMSKRCLLLPICNHLNRAPSKRVIGTMHPHLSPHRWCGESTGVAFLQVVKPSCPHGALQSVTFVIWR